MALTTVINDILWNLDTLAALGNHQTLMVMGDRLFVDQRYFQCLQRHFTGDSRQQILKATEKTLKMLDEVLKSYALFLEQPAHNPRDDTWENMLHNLQALRLRKDKVLQGMTVLRTFERYESDPAFTIELSRFMACLQKSHKKCEELEQRLHRMWLPTRVGTDTAHPSPSIAGGPTDAPTSPTSQLALQDSPLLQSTPLTNLELLRLPP
jgi:hypothetical protein